VICRRENRIQNINQTRDENLLVVVEELNEVVFTTEERYSLLFCFEIVFFDITVVYIVVLIIYIDCIKQFVLQMYYQTCYPL